jgi:hypothetical protein
MKQAWNYCRILPKYGLDLRSYNVYLIVNFVMGKKEEMQTVSWYVTPRNLLEIYQLSAEPVAFVFRVEG